MLCSNGLLNILFKTSKDVNPRSLGDGSQSARKAGQGNGEEDEVEDRSLRLGLRNVCFDRLLVTSTTRLGWDIVVILCVFTVIVGFALTVVVFTFLWRSLPALSFLLMLRVMFFVIQGMTF
jgi:hypothetical protein